jgi:hypothetical protein
MTFTIDDPRQCVGATLYGQGHEKIGKIGQLYLDDTTGRPEWATVATGLFGRRESFVPLEDATQTDEGIVVPYDKDLIKDAPNVEPEQGHITREEEQQLDEHYRRGMAAGSADRGDGVGQRADDRSTDDRGDHGTDGEHTVPDGSPAGTAMPGTTAATTGGTQPVAPSPSAAGVDTPGESSGRSAESAAQPGGTGPRLRRWVEVEYESVEVPVQRERVAYDDDNAKDSS